jgi:hypothetical protein
MQVAMAQAGGERARHGLTGDAHGGAVQGGLVRDNRRQRFRSVDERGGEAQLPAKASAACERGEGFHDRHVRGGQHAQGIDLAARARAIEEALAQHRGEHATPAVGAHDGALAARQRQHQNGATPARAGQRRARPPPQRSGHVGEVGAHVADAARSTNTALRGAAPSTALGFSAERDRGTRGERSKRRGCDRRRARRARQAHRSRRPQPMRADVVATATTRRGRRR